jgi:type I restriction enzyme R subunit
VTLSHRTRHRNRRSRQAVETVDLQGQNLDQGRKSYVDGGAVVIAAESVWELAADGARLRVVSLTDYTQETVRKLFPNSAALRAEWARPDGRTEVLAQLAERGIDLDQLRRVSQQPEADAFDLLGHLAFSAPVRTRRERANVLRRERREFFERFYGYAQFLVPDVLKVPPISDKGNVIEIAAFFGGAQQLRDAVNELQTLLYAA